MFQQSTFRRLPHSFLNWILFSLFLFCSLPQLVCSQNLNTQKTSETTILELGKPIEREISSQEKHSYQIKLSANQYVKIIIEQRGVDIIAHLSGDDNKPMADFDAEMRPNDIETVDFIADLSGSYRLDIESRYPLLAGGKYEIRFVELRAASEPDKSLQEARNAYAESLRLYNAGKFSDALPLVERALEICKREFGGLENPKVALAMTHLARIKDAQGEYEKAAQINQQVLIIREKILGVDHPDVAYTLNYLGINYEHQADYQKAISFHQRALAIREKDFGLNHPIVATSLTNLGIVYNSLGDKSKTEELYQRALAIQERAGGSENTNMAASLINFAYIYNKNDEYQKAQPFAQRAVIILEKLVPPEHPLMLAALNNLSNSYLGQGDYKKAEPLALRVFQSSEKTLGSKHPQTALAAQNLASVYGFERNFEKAEPLFRQALEVRESIFGADNPRVSRTLSSLSLLLAEKGDLEHALKLLERANAIDERNINLNLAVGSERQKLAYLNNLFGQTNQNIFLQTRFAPDNKLAIELAATTVLRQKGRILDAVSNNLIELRHRFNLQDQAFLDDLNKITKEMAELILNGPEDGNIPAHQSKIRMLTDKREKLEDEISRRAAGFYTKFKPVTISSVQALVPRGSALLEFAIYYPMSLNTSSYDKPNGEPRYVVYVIQNQGEVKWKELGDAKQIDEAIEAFRLSLQDPQRKDVEQLARALDKKVMQPVRALLGDVKRLLVSPDGALNLIPFEALVNEQNHYLIENYSFTYLTSGRDLLRMQVARESKAKPLVLANPSFGEPLADQSAKNTTPRTNKRSSKRSVTTAHDLSETYFAPLGGTTQEARSIQSLFPEATVLTGGAATETALKQAAAPSILHIATHGFFLQSNGTNLSGDLQAAPNGSSANVKSENPLLRSGLALAGANARRSSLKIGDDDGILTALEASGLNLWGTKLVVLSACDTGLGEVRNGEGVYGLRRAFVLAGTESMVMSLWSVSDYITRELMTNYYKNLKQGMGRGGALRQVQLEMLKRNERKHPFYWAGFIQSGEWATLDNQRR